MRRPGCEWPGACNPSIVLNSAEFQRQLSKRAELKTRSIEEQQEAAERNKLYQARYREKCAMSGKLTLSSDNRYRHRQDLRAWEALRRRE
jgi:hypothetical protein